MGVGWDNVEKQQNEARGPSSCRDPIRRIFWTRTRERRGRQAGVWRVYTHSRGVCFGLYSVLFLQRHRCKRQRERERQTAMCYRAALFHKRCGSRTVAKRRGEGVGVEASWLERQTICLCRERGRLRGLFWVLGRGTPCTASSVADGGASSSAECACATTARAGVWAGRALALSPPDLTSVLSGPRCPTRDSSF